MVFQRWFTVGAEEASVASELSVYLRAVKKAAPSLLAFLVNLADDNGNTVLHYSVSHCNYSIVSLLLETGACVCRLEERKPACEILTLYFFSPPLGRAGASDVNLQNNAGYTAVMLASLTAPDGPGGVEVVRKLMELGNIHIRSKQVTGGLWKC